MENSNEERNTPETFEIKDVEIFRAGTWTDSAGRTVAYTEDDLKEMAESHRALEGRLDPPVKLGHDPEQPLLSADGLPAAGWLRNVRAQGGRLLADLVGVPAKVYDLIRAGAYRKRSLEVLHGYLDEATGATHKHVAAGLALLGAALPAIGSLADIGALYGTSSGCAAYLYESGPAGILDDGCADVSPEPTDADNPEDEMTMSEMIEKIAALEARIVELEALLIIAEKQDAELDEGPEAESREETASEDGTGLDNADAEATEVAGDVADAPQEDSSEQDEASGATEPELETDAAEDEGGDKAQDGLAADGAQTADETESEPAEVMANEGEAADTAEEENQEARAESEEMAAALDVVLENLREARERLDEHRMREAAVRERARRQFVSRNAGRIPPAFRGLVIDLLAILDGDACAASDYSLAPEAGRGIAEGFRGFVSALSEHPAMSEYGREGGSGGGEAGGAGDDPEELIKSYCAARGLDYDDASDYSRAALAALEYEKPREKDGKVAPYGNENLETSLCVQCGGEYDNDMGTQTDERHIRHESDYAKSGGVAEKIKNVVKAGAEAVSGKNKSCQAGKVWIAPVWQLKAAAAFEKRIGDFEPGCYGEMEFAAYYAMNMIAQNVMRKPRDKEHIKGCLMKYMEFREEGRKVFFKKLSESK